VSTIDVKTRAKHPDDITVGPSPAAVAVTPDGKTAFVTKSSGTVDDRREDELAQRDGVDDRVRTETERRIGESVPPSSTRTDVPFGAR
jgi:DNA-binding beta-propeller fold protein YncE